MNKEIEKEAIKSIKHDIDMLSHSLKDGLDLFTNDFCEKIKKSMIPSIFVMKSTSILVKEFLINFIKENKDKPLINKLQSIIDELER